MSQNLEQLPVAVLGAGPIGIEAALALADAGRLFVLLEAGDRVAASVRRWGHVRLFTPWSLDVSPRLRRHLEAAGHVVPDSEECPTGAELSAQVLEPAARLPVVAEHLLLGLRVLEIGRRGLLKHEEIGSAERGRRPFRLLVEDAAGRQSTLEAAAVLDCTGTYDQPNALGEAGIAAPGESAAGERIVRHIPDLTVEADEWASRRILLVGAGHSAQTAARDLAGLAEERPGTEVVWALRGEAPPKPLPGDALPDRARLARDAAELARGDGPLEMRRGVTVDAVEAPDDVSVPLRVWLRPMGNGTEPEMLEIDRILSLTGYVGDHRLYRQLQVHECYATCGPIKLAAALLGSASEDCLTAGGQDASTLVNPEPGFFILGSKSYGRNTTFLLRSGWRQVDDALALLAGEGS
ncbi:MAG: flavoprotein [Acidobacteriota bacterium]|nr:flavoprotein [Acidobacteriota bacterium]